MTQRLPGMTVLRSTHALCLCLCCAGTAGAAPAAAVADAAAAACEKAVSEAVQEARGGAAQEVLFSGARRALSPTGESETAVKGEGRYRAGRRSPAQAFTYTCAYNAETGATSGVLFSELGGSAVAAAPARPWQPDLTHLSPEACEAAAAADLKRKHPRVERITFGSDSRELRPGAEGRTRLEGTGAMVRAAGMQATVFTYRCDVESQSGQIEAVQTAE